MPKRHKATWLTGIVEGDMNFFRGSFKGKWTKAHRKARQHGRRRKGEPLVPVLIMLDRSEHEADFVLTHNNDEVHPCMNSHIKPGAVLCTDGSDLYPPFAASEGFCHRQIFPANTTRTLDDGAFHIQPLTE